jgi:uncharacterized protein
MFRPIRRTKRQIDDEAAKELLRKSRRGVLAVNGDDGYPYAVPINFLYVEEDNKIYFHGAKAGHKIDALKKSDKVCFTVYGNEFIKDPEWAPYVQSTVVFGRCHLLETNVETLAMVKRFAMKYFPSEDIADKEIENSGKAMQIFEIEIEHLAGKQIQER